MTKGAHTPHARPATDAFFAAKADIDALLERISATSADHFNTDPEAITWGDVDGLAHIRARLQEISDLIHGEGEHAH